MKLITTFTCLPTSSSVSVYVLDVASWIGVSVSSAIRIHCHAKSEAFGNPSASAVFPVPAVRVWPGRALPVMSGVPVASLFAGRLSASSRVS